MADYMVFGDYYDDDEEQSWGCVQERYEREVDMGYEKWKEERVLSDLAELKEDERDNC